MQTRQLSANYVCELDNTEFQAAYDHQHLLFSEVLKSGAETVQFSAASGMNIWFTTADKESAEAAIARVLRIKNEKHNI